MKWPTVLRNRANGSPTEPRFRSRLPVHLLRFTVLVVGLLVVGELFIGLGTCLDVKYGNPLEGAAHCAAAVLFYVDFFVPYLLPFHLMPVIFVARASTAFWAWRDRNRF